MKILLKNRVSPLLSIRTEYLIYTILVTSFFINVQNIPPLLKLKQGFIFLLCITLCGNRLIRTEKDFNLILILLTTCITLICFTFTNETFFMTDSLIILTLLSIPYWKPLLQDSKVLQNFEFATAFMIILNLLVFRSNGRGTIGNIDPNFSSLLVFLFACYLLKMKRSKWLISVIILAGFLTLSRTYLVAIALLLISYIIKNRKILIASFLFLPVVFLGFLHFFTTGSLEERFPILYKISETLYYSSGEHTNLLRILHIVGNTSDNIRAVINVKTIELLASNKSVLLFGSNPETFESVHGFKTAHNFFLFQISQSGLLLGIIALLSVYYLFMKKFIGTNTAILIGFSAYFSFLGIEVGSVYFIFLISILYLVPEKAES